MDLNGGVPSLGGYPTAVIANGNAHGSSEELQGVIPSNGVITGNGIGYPGVVPGLCVDGSGLGGVISNCAMGASSNGINLSMVSHDCEGGNQELLRVQPVDVHGTDEVDAVTASLSPIPQYDGDDTPNFTNKNLMETA